MDSQRLRMQNVTGREHCPWCCDGDGWVFVGWSAVGTDQMAPCPRCEKGRQLEFPEAGRGPWGPDGFWRGQPGTGLTRTCTCKQQPLSRAENLRKLEQLAGPREMPA